MSCRRVQRAPPSAWRESVEEGGRSLPPSVAACTCPHFPHCSHCAPETPRARAATPCLSACRRCAAPRRSCRPAAPLLAPAAPNRLPRPPPPLLPPASLPAAPPRGPVPASFGCLAFPPQPSVCRPCAWRSSPSPRKGRPGICPGWRPPPGRRRSPKRGRTWQCARCCRCRCCRAGRGSREGAI